MVNESARQLFNFRVDPVGSACRYLQCAGLLPFDAASIHRLRCEQV